MVTTLLVILILKVKYGIFISMYVLVILILRAKYGIFMCVYVLVSLVLRYYMVFSFGVCTRNAYTLS